MLFRAPACLFNAEKWRGAVAPVVIDRAKSCDGVLNRRQLFNAGNTLRRLAKSTIVYVLVTSPTRVTRPTCEKILMVLKLRKVIVNAANNARELTKEG